MGIGRGESFAVRLFNDSEYDAAVKLTIDGINMFAFSDNAAEQVERPAARRLWSRRPGSLR